MQYNRLRYYDPSIGRFISEDPLSFAAGDSNIYRYVGNNPLFYIDPSGLCGVGAGAGAGADAGAGNNSLSSPPPAPSGVNPPPSAEGAGAGNGGFGSPGEVEYSIASDSDVRYTPFNSGFSSGDNRRPSRRTTNYGELNPGEEYILRRYLQGSNGGRSLIEESFVDYQGNPTREEYIFAGFTDLPSFGSNFAFNNFISEIKKLLGSDPNRYSELDPDEERDNFYDEQQRQWAIKIIEDNRDYIIKTAEYYNVTPDAIAGVIYWEAIENPYNFWTRGVNPLGNWTRPGTIFDFGIPGKIHTSSDDIAALVEDTVEKRRPDAFVDDGLRYDIVQPDALVDDDEELRFDPIENRKYYLSESELREQRLLNDQTVAIEYIGAILNHHATTYETIVKQATTINGETLRSNFSIRDQAGILGILFQGGFSKERQKLISNKFKQNPLTAQPSFPQPSYPGENVETMGAWISQEREWINDSISQPGDKYYRTWQ